MYVWFPKAIERINPEFRAQVAREVDLEQGSRLVHGMYVYPIFLLVLGKTTDIFHEHPALMQATLWAMGASLLLRLCFLIGSRRLHDFNPVAWRIGTTVCVASVSITAGFLLAAITALYGVSCWTYSAAVVWTSGCVGGSLSSFVANGVLRKLQLFSHLLPGIAAAWFFGGERGHAAVVAYAILIAFVYIQGSRLEVEYWENVLRQFRESERSRELEAARLAAEQANNAKSYFIANVSHEVRTPLNGVLGMISLAQEAQTETERKELLETARSSAEYLLQVINEILDFSKIEAGKLVIEFVEMDLVKLLNEVMGMFSTQAERKGLRLGLEIEPAVPAFVRGDCVRIRQVLINLLGNALKFTQTGSITLRVQSAAENRHEVTFSVQDTGIGIPTDRQDLIFEAFSQADASTTRRFGGTGLGLTISSRLVAAMSGKLNVASEPGRGSIFSFTLPLLEVVGKTANNEMSGAVDNVRTLPAPGDNNRRLDILLVEDNPVNQKLGQKLLERAGHMVTLASNGREGVERSAEHAYDVILMDLQMPEMDGLEATSLIRERDKKLGVHTPIVALTAHALPEHEVSCRAAGMNGYLTKPLNKEKLYEQLSQFAPGQKAA